MKKVLLAFIAIFCIHCSVFANEIVINNETYELQYSAKDNREIMNEYVRPHENLYNWGKIFTVYHVFNYDAREFLLRQIDSYKNRPYIKMIKTDLDKNMYSMIFMSKENGKVLYDYVVIRTEQDGTDTKLLHWDLRYCNSDGTKYPKKSISEIIEEDKKYSDILLKITAPKMYKEFYEKK